MIELNDYHTMVYGQLEGFLESSGFTNIFGDTCADFDGTMYQLQPSNFEESKTKVQVACNMLGFDQVCASGDLPAYLESVYGAGNVVAPPTGYKVAVEVDFANVPGATEDAKKAYLKEVSRIKQVVLRFPLVNIFKQTNAGSPPSGVTCINHRKEPEAMYIDVAKKEMNINVTFCVAFEDAADIAIADVFMKEFSECRRRESSLGNAPAVSFSLAAPAQLEGLNCKEGEGIGYMTFVLFPRHYKEDKAAQTISVCLGFRNYLHYHIKCSKANMLTRMRKRCEDLLQVLRKAAPEPLKEKEKKTATGRVFKRG